MEAPHAPDREGTDLTVLVPLYNEEDSLRELKERIAAEFDRAGLRGEILFVDDGSTDRSYAVIEELAAADDRVRAIKFRSNFGKAAALDAGFRDSRGAMVITMDADLQDDPAEIPNLLRRLEEGFDVVSGWKKKRHDPITKTVPSKFFNFVTAMATGIRIHDFNCGLKAYRASAVREIRLYGELHRYIPALAAWRGFRVGELAVTHHPRRHGRSKYGPKRFLAGFLDLMTVMLLTRFTVKPLHLFGLVGTLMGLGGVGISLYMVGLKIVYGDIRGRVPLLSFAVLLIIMGMQFLSTGLLAEMIASRNADQTTHYSIERRLGS